MAKLVQINAGFPMSYADDSIPTDQIDQVESLESVFDDIAHTISDPMMDFEGFIENLEEYSYLVYHATDEESIS